MVRGAMLLGHLLKISANFALKQLGLHVQKEAHIQVCMRGGTEILLMERTLFLDALLMKLALRLDWETLHVLQVTVGKLAQNGVWDGSALELDVRNVSLLLFNGYSLFWFLLLSSYFVGE
jgi:hypothetical protein